MKVVSRGVYWDRSTKGVLNKRHRGLSSGSIERMSRRDCTRFLASLGALDEEPL